MTPAPQTEPLARWRVIDTIFLASVRADMRTELTRHGYDESTIDSIALVMTELAGNAFQHGATPVEIALDAGPAALVVRVTDAGDGFDDEIAALLTSDQQGVLPLSTVGADATGGVAGEEAQDRNGSDASDLKNLPENGRGLQIASALADVRVVQRTVNGRPLTTVTATIAVERPEVALADVDPLGVLVTTDDPDPAA